MNVAMVVKYIAVISKNVEEEAAFFQSSLGYQLAGEIELWPQIICKILTINEGPSQVMLVPEPIANPFRNLIILSTDNCLKDYHHIKNSGVEFCTSPYYIANGMVAEFEDKSGNHFILLEEREYEEI